MSKKVSPIPRGYRTATPCLTVASVDNAIEFYQAAFGAEVVTRYPGDEAFVAVHATIKIGNSIVALNCESPEQGILAPATMGGSQAQTHLYVEDVDAAWLRAVEAGALVHTPLYDAYWGDRTGLLMDNSGHLWSLASKIENVSREEIHQRAGAALTAGSAIGEASFPVEAPLVEEEIAA